MKNVSVSVIGIKPFLYNKFNVEELSNTKKIKEGSAGNNPSQWKNSIWNEGKKLYVPGFYFLPALKSAGKYVKQGRGSISNTIPSAITILDDKVYFNRELPDEIENMTNEDISKDSSSPVYLDIRAVSNPATKGKNIRYRLALSPGWEFSFNFLWDDTLLSKDQITQTIENLGKLIGFSDGRTLGYGRFDVKEIKIN